MPLEVVWSRFAETQLDKIFEYYTEEAGILIARKLLTSIILEADKLIEAPLIGQREEMLKDREIDYRYLLYKNYKLIYSVDHENHLIKIADVFDTRQNPPKIKRGK